MFSEARPGLANEEVAGRCDSFAAKLTWVQILFFVSYFTLCK